MQTAYISMPAATEALREFTLPFIGSDTEKSHPACQIGSYPFFREGRVGANFVVRSTDRAALDACMAALCEGLEAQGFALTPGGI